MLFTRNFIGISKFEFIKNMKKNILLILITILLAFTACKTTRTTIKPVVKSNNTVIQLIEQIQKKQPTFTSANISKMSLALNMSNREVNVNATCKIQKDSAIHLSIQPFMGIELFKAELTPDSLRVFDKMNKQYYAVDYSFFQKRFGVDVDFYSLQSLLFGQFFCIGSKEIKTEACIATDLSNNRKNINFENQTMLQSTEISADFIIQQVVLKSKNSNYELRTNYKDFILLNGINFPQQIAMTATNQKNDASCDFSILRVEFNTLIKFSALNPDRYNRGDIEQLLKK